MKQITQCPICSHEKFSFAIECNDHTYSNKLFKVVSCDACSFWFTNPVPEAENIGEYYKSDAYVSHTKTKKGLINTLYHFVKSHAIKKKFSLVNPYFSAKPSLLDYGCGGGDFLAYCKKKNVNVAGYEPSEDARKAAEKTSGLSLKNTAEISAETKKFNVITMWHVLEHVYDLDSDFSALASCLSEDGRLIVAVPNRESYDALYYKESWAAYDLPRHLYHFTKNDISSFAKKHGFEVEKIKPMVFDSYYVSMLSEKYAKGFFLKGFWSGLISNIKAKNSPPNHSSLIYILKKAK